MTLNEPTTPEVSQVATSQVAEEQTPVTEDLPQDGESTETTPEVKTPEAEAPATTTPKVEGQQQTPERQPTRAEKRLHQILEKNRRGDINPLAALTQGAEILPDENGYYTPEQVKQMSAKAAAEVIQLDRDLQAYHQETEAFVSDIEEVGAQIEADFKDNPELAEKVNKILTNQIRAANIRIDEKGNEVLVPVQKPTELYQQLKEALNLTKKQGTEQVTAALAKQVAEGAITPTTASSSGEESLASLQQNLWKDPKKVRETLAKRLPRSND